MLARGIESYSRPGRLDQALQQVAGGARPLAGGTRLLAQSQELGELVDLASLGLNGIESRDGELWLGAMVTLQDVIDSAACHDHTRGLLPQACATHSASRTLRGMATLGGEAVAAAADSETVAALLALNAVFQVAQAGGSVEIPALAFLRRPSEHLGVGGLLTGLVLPDPPQGAALERVALLPSAPSLLAVAVGVSYTGVSSTAGGESAGKGVCSRARLALTGLASPPARIREAEARLERSDGGTAAIQRCIEEIQARAPFLDDAHASAAYRRRVVEPLVRRSLERATRGSKEPESREPLRTRSRKERPAPAEMQELSRGELEITVNRVPRRAAANAGTTLLEWLRAQGLWGVKHGCETGECGACTVLLEGRPIVSCLTLAAQAHGRAVETVEGLGSADEPHPIQTAFAETGAIQCGFCTPAMELCAKALLDEVPDPSETEVRDALAGCLCRCTGYVKPVEAVQRAALEQAKGRGRG